MALLTLYKRNQVALSTEQLVLKDQDVEEIDSTLKIAKNVEELLEAESSRIAAAETAARNAGYEAGFEKGQSEGYEAALEHIAVKLVALAKEANIVREVLEQQSGNLAVRIVQKIAADVGPSKTVAALAATAARELVPREPIVLRVSPDNEQTVLEHMVALSSSFADLVQVVPDTSVGLTDCVLETEFGMIKAGLDIQLNALMEKFNGV